MRRRALQAVLLASAFGSLCIWAVVLSMAPRLRAREASNRLIEKAQQIAGGADPAASRELVDEALAADPENPRAHRELAMHLLARGETEQAVGELERAALADPANSGAALEVAAVLHAQQDMEATLHWLREAARREPDSGLTYTVIAQCLLESKDIPGALRAAQRAVALSPRYEPAYVVLGSARWQSRDLPGARAAFDEALRLRPSDVDALLAAASVSHALGLSDPALDYARRAVGAGPRDRRAWLAFAQLLADRGRAAEAQQALSRARALPTPGGSSRP